jgi:proteasome lid subunit RPN8/RPN11
MQSEIVKMKEINEVIPKVGIMPSSQPAEFVTYPWGDVENKDIVIFLDIKALIKIYRHSKSSVNKEVGGFLVGYPLKEEDKLFVQIVDATPAQHVHSKGEALSFTHQTWKMLDCQMNERFKGKHVVGWYHTHPGLGLFMSPYDTFIHNHFFSLPWQIALVIDPATENQMFFQKKNKKMIASGYYLYTQKDNMHIQLLKKVIDRLKIAEKRERSGRYKRYKMVM